MTRGWKAFHLMAPFGIAHITFIITFIDVLVITQVNTSIVLSILQIPLAFPYRIWPVLPIPQLSRVEKNVALQRRYCCRNVEAHINQQYHPQHHRIKYPDHRSKCFHANSSSNHPFTSNDAPIILASSAFRSYNIRVGYLPRHYTKTLLFERLRGL